MNIDTDTNIQHTVTIYVPKWRTGGTSFNRTGRGETKLLNEHGYSCCLGFACKQIAGLSDVRLLNRTTPASVVECIPKLTMSRGSNGVENTTFSDAAMTINDSDDTLPSRIAKLTSFGRENGISFVFIYSDLEQ